MPVLLILEIVVPWLIIVLVTMVAASTWHCGGAAIRFGWLLLSAAMGPIGIIALVGTRSADLKRQARPPVDGAPRVVVGRTRIIVGSDGSAADLALRSTSCASCTKALTSCSPACSRMKQSLEAATRRGEIAMRAWRR